MTDDPQYGILQLIERNTERIGAMKVYVQEALDRERQLMAIISSLATLITHMEEDIRETVAKLRDAGEPR